LIAFLKRPELKCGYHRTHIVLPNSLLPKKFTELRNQHVHHEDAKKHGAKFERACHKGPCSSQVEIIHPKFGEAWPVVVIYIPGGGMWAGDATALGVITGKSGRNFMHGLPFGRQAADERDTDFEQRMSDTVNQYRCTVITDMPRAGQLELARLLNEEDHAEEWDEALPLMLKAEDRRRWVAFPLAPQSSLSSRKGHSGGTNSVIAERKRPAKDLQRIVKTTGKPATDRHQEKSSNGGTKTGEEQLRRGNAGTDAKFAVNLITNSLGLSAVELAAYKKVHGDLRKFMGDTKNSKTAASDLGIMSWKISQFLCGTLKCTAAVRLSISAVAEALEGR
jgi:hypothetical protein